MPKQSPSILRLPAEQQLAQYCRSHRQRERKQKSIICLHDQEKRYLDEFVSIYEETMRRVYATQSYFYQLRDQLGPVSQLFVARAEERVIAASLFTICDEIVQYFLSGTRTDSMKLSPTTTILDRARTILPGYALHLGDGLGGSNEDSLFAYKAGFSDRRHRFSTWRWIIQPDIYKELCEGCARINGAKGLEPTSAEFFPAYRCPTLPRKIAEPRIYLSPPHMGHTELEMVKEAFSSNWVAPVGPHVDAFEREFADYLGLPHAAAVCSGTAAIHLAVRLLGVQPGDEVLCSTLTFVASANPVVYEGATPVFIDSEPSSWNMDPDLLQAELNACAERGRLPKAVIVVDLYGQSVNYDPILEACARYDVPLIQDSAEALGASYKGHKVGTQGRCAIFSFNGNKIITTSGGGMLVSSDAALIERARFLATQARDPAPHYQHSAVGYNYRLSNVLAGIGRGQLRVLPERIAARKGNFEQYKAAFEGVVGIEMMPIAPYGEPNYWLTVVVIDPMKFGRSSEEVRLALAAHNIEARPVWKPLHMQPVFAQYRVRGGRVAESIFARGLCLPSGSKLTQTEIDRICAIILNAPNRSQGVHS